MQTAHRGKPYTDPASGVKPLNRSNKPCNFGNLTKAPSVESSDFMNTGEGETVEEQQYSSNIIPHTEIHIETDMGYEEWLATQGFLGLKSDAKSTPEKGMIDDTPPSVYKQLRQIHYYLDEIFGFVQENIVSEAEQEPLLRKLDAIAACIRVKPIFESVKKQILVNQMEMD